VGEKGDYRPMTYVLFLVTLALVAFGILGGLVISSLFFLLIPVGFAILAVRDHTRSA